MRALAAFQAALGGRRDEFYDLELDPDELSDLSADPSYAREIGEHRAWLEEFVRTHQVPRRR